MKKMRQAPNLVTRCRQKGAVLIFCLVFLAILTMLGVSGMESTILEERMSGNMRDYTLAFQAAESALKNAEAWLVTQDALPFTSDDGSTTVWAVDSMDPPVNDGAYWWDHVNINAAWWAANGDALINVASVNAQPVYVIEEYRVVDTGQSIAIGGGEVTLPRILYRITAQAVGVNATTEVKLQSTFVRTY
jgi:type IV pilus assembly protein PilX